MNKSDLKFILVILTGNLICQLIAYGVSEKYNPTINYLALFTVAVQWIAFLHAGGILFNNERTEKYYDFMGSVTFLLTLILSLSLSHSHITIRQIILSALVGIWTMRLGYFLFTRIHNNNGIDSRFTQIKANNFRFFMTWNLQGFWVFFSLIPIFVVNHTSNDKNLHLLDYVGVGVWIFGLLFEATADAQKSKFRSNPANKEKFIACGLWKISRHPNYFGEITLWLGVALSAFAGSHSYSVFISPILSALLLIFVSGIPLLELKADEKFGKDPEYQIYKKNTPVLFPFIGRCGDAKF